MLLPLPVSCLREAEIRRTLYLIGRSCLSLMPLCDSCPKLILSFFFHRDKYSIYWVNVLDKLPTFCMFQFSSVQLLSCVWLFATPWITAHQASLFITNFWSSLKLVSIESVMPSSHLILCRPLLLLPLVPPSFRVFSNESTVLMRWPKYWSFSFNISPSSEHPELISFRMDWLDLLAVQGTLKSSLIMWVEIWAAYLDPVDQCMERIGLRFLPSCVSRLNQSSSVA